VANRMGFSETLADINFTPYPIRRQYSRKTLIVHLCNIALLGTQMRLRLTFSPTPPLQHPLLRVHRRWSIEFPRRIPKWVHYDGGCVSTFAMAERALPYQEPGITALLTLSSFLYLLNVINHLLDRWIYCGLLGQIFIGVAWGMPGAQWISKAVQGVFTQLGSLGLVLLVYEGMIAAPLLHHLIG